MAHQAIIPIQWQLLTLLNRITKIGSSCTTLYLHIPNASRFLCRKSENVKVKVRGINKQFVFSFNVAITSPVSLCGSFTSQEFLGVWMAAEPHGSQLKPAVLSLVSKSCSVKCKRRLYSTCDISFCAARSCKSKGFIVFSITCKCSCCLTIFGC